MLWLIDDRGKTWPGETHPITKWDAAERPLGYAIWERGFVYLRSRAGAMTIAFNPRRTRRITLATTAYFVSTCGGSRVALTHGAPTRLTTEIFGRIDAALQRMEELCAALPPERAVILREQRRQIAWSAGENRMVAAGRLIEAWRETGQVWTDALYAKLRERHLLTAASVARGPAGAARFTNTHWGPELGFLSDQWARVAVGKDVREQPFRILGRNIARLYRQTVTEEQPARYDVSVILPAPDGELYHYSFERLLLPWRCGRDRCVVHALLGLSRGPAPVANNSARVLN